MRLRLLLILSCIFAGAIMPTPCHAQGLGIYESSGGVTRRSWRPNSFISSGLAVANGLGPFEWRLEGNVPAGFNITAVDLGLRRSIFVRGNTPATPGTYSFSARATDTFSGLTGVFMYELVVGATLDLVANTTFFATAGRPYRGDFVVNGGNPTGPCEWIGISSGFQCSLSPPGPGGTPGVLSGTSDSIGEMTTELRVVTDVGPAFIKNITVYVVAPISLTTSPLNVTADVGAEYSASAGLTGGAFPRTIELTAGSIPPGTQLTQYTDSVAVRGRLLSPGTYRYTLTAGERWGTTASAEFTVVVRAISPPAITSAAPAAGTAGVPYNHVFTYQNGVYPIRWSVLSGALPDGLTLDASTGFLSGRPLRTGAFSFTVAATDSSIPPLTGTQNVVLTINAPPPLTITTGPTLPTVFRGLPCRIVVRGSGVAPLEWSGTGVPPGLSLESSGAIGGIPAAAGIYQVSVTVKDWAGQTATATLTLPVEERSAFVLPEATAGALYRVGNEAVKLPLPVGILAPFSWRLDQGSLPSGLILDATGTISGTTLTVGDFRFTALVGDSLGQSFTRDYLITVRQSAPTPTSYAIPSNGVLSLQTSAGSQASKIFYGLLGAASTGPVRQGRAFFEYRHGGILVSETSVPASEPVREGRILVDTRHGWNTGLAIANPNAVTATVQMTLIDEEGRTVASPRIEVPPNGQVASFLTEAPYNVAPNFLGTAAFTTSQAVGVLAISGLVNERQDFLMTTLPVITQSSNLKDVLVPQFAAGGGWSTQLDLVNPASERLLGTVEFLSPGSVDNPSQPVALLLNGTLLTSFDYSIPPNGVRRLVVEGRADNTSVGSVRIHAGVGTAPSGILRYGYRRNGVTVSTTAMAFIRAAESIRLFAESSTAFSVRNGLAVANPSSVPVDVTLRLLDSKGAEVGNTAFTLGPNGQLARYIDEFPTLNLPSNFQGVLSVSAPSPGVAVYGIRGRINEALDFVFSTSQPVDFTASSAEPKVFPHLIDGGGYKTTIAIIDGVRRPPTVLWNCEISPEFL